MSYERGMDTTNRKERFGWKPGDIRTVEQEARLKALREERDALVAAFSWLDEVDVPTPR